MKTSSYPNTAQAEILSVRSPSAGWGGPWTSEKLEKIERYLIAYRKVFLRIKLKPIYIDAFAGAGRHYLETREAGQLSFPEFGDETAERLIDGSPRLALGVDPAFERYYFIDSKLTNVNKLRELKSEFSDRAGAINVLHGDANEQVLNLCKQINWAGHRAVIFLDPYGMQVDWATLEAIAATGAIDLWYLFPLGVAVNRLLTTSGDIGVREQAKLDSIFGEQNWREEFYKKSNQVNLFGGTSDVVKNADFNAIESYFHIRLSSIFPVVAENPARLSNSKGNPLYSLFFASANSGKGGATALRIARHILNM